MLISFVLSSMLMQHVDVFRSMLMPFAAMPLVLTLLGANLPIFWPHALVIEYGVACALKASYEFFYAYRTRKACSRLTRLRICGVMAERSQLTSRLYFGTREHSHVPGRGTFWPEWCMP